MKKNLGTIRTIAKWYFIVNLVMLILTVIYGLIARHQGLPYGFRTEIVGITISFVILALIKGYETKDKGTVVICMLAVLFMSSCTKNTNTELKSNSTVTTRTITAISEKPAFNNVITSETLVSLKSCPFTGDDVYITKSDWGTWNIDNIKKYAYKFGSVTGFIIPNKDGIRSLCILYNPNTDKCEKILAKQIPITFKKYNLYYESALGVPHLSIDIMVEPDGTLSGSNAVIGESPALVTNLGQITHYTDLSAAPPCSGGTGFNKCFACLQAQCSDSWGCSLACAFAAVACVLAHMATCAAWN